MILACFFDWMNSHRRKFKVWHCYSSFGQCLSLECIVTIGSCGQTKTDGGDNALNLQPQRRGVQRLIQDRVEDLRFFQRRQKACVWGGKSLRASPQMSIDSSSIQPRRSSQTCCRDSQKSVNWQRGSSNQVAARPWYSCSGLLLHPHSLLCFLAVAQPKLLLSHGDSFQRLLFCLVKKLQTTDVHLWKRLIFGTLLLSLV